MNWYVKNGPSERGPLTVDAIRLDIQDGSVARDSLVRREDSKSWQPLGFSEIAEELGLRKANTNLESLRPDLVKPIGMQAGFFRFTLILFFAVYGLNLVINLYLLANMNLDTGFVSQELFSTPPGMLVALLANFLPVAGIAALLISAIGYGIFFHHALYNVRQMGADEATMKPFEAWIWHIVPIALLWKPMEAISQIWHASHRMANEDEMSNPIGIWWACWLIAVIGNRILANVYNTMTDQSSLPMAMSAESVIILLFLVAAFLLWGMTARIQKLQKAMAEGGQANVF